MAPAIEAKTRAGLDSDQHLSPQRPVFPFNLTARVIRIIVPRGAEISWEISEENAPAVGAVLEPDCEGLSLDRQEDDLRTVLTQRR